MDKNKVAMIAVGSGIVGLLIGIAVSSFHHDGRDGHDHDMNHQDDEKGGLMDRRDTEGSVKKDDDMMNMDHSMMGHDIAMTVSSEREFIEEMIPHHVEAVATAKEVVLRGGSTMAIKALAEGIVAAQEQEIANMKTWYKNWYGVEYADKGTYNSMMKPLTDLSGAELDKVFLTDMIAHHKMAIMMAESVDAHIEHDEIKTLSQNIKTTQAAEITIMQNLLTTLK